MAAKIFGHANLPSYYKTEMHRAAESGNHVFDKIAGNAVKGIFSDAKNFRRRTEFCETRGSPLVDDRSL